MNSSGDDIKAMPDGTLLYNFTIPTQPATKKNSNRIVKIKGFVKIIPSERFVKYQRFCGPFLTPLRKDKKLPPINCGISIAVKVFCKDWRLPDITNIYQSLGDIFQHYDLISNDKWIHWTDNFKGEPQHWFGGVDKINPRVEIEIKRYRHQLETFQDAKKK
jgi:hypothetical protein